MKKTQLLVVILSYGMNINNRIFKFLRPNYYKCISYNAYNLEVVFVILTKVDKAVIIK